MAGDPNDGDDAGEGGGTHLEDREGWGGESVGEVRGGGEERGREGRNHGEMGKEVTG